MEGGYGGSVGVGGSVVKHVIEKKVLIKYYY
jgi:hypothetical protein